MVNFQDIHIEKDFWDDFIVEAFEHIDEIESNAMSLEQNPEDMEIIHTMFRAFHTIKGLSGFVEHTAIQEVAHKTETMMDLCRKGELPVTTKIVDAILKSSDYIKQLCENIEAYKDEGLVNRIEALLLTLEELSNPEDNAASASAIEPVQTVVAPESVAEIEPPAEDSKEIIEAEIVFETEEPVVKEDTSEDDEWAAIEQRAKKVKEDIASEFVFDRDATEQDEAVLEEKTEKEKQQPKKEEQAGKKSSNKKIVKEEIVPKEETIKFEIKEQEKEKEEEKHIVDPALAAFQKETMEKLKGGAAPVLRTETAVDNSAAKATSANEEYMKVANYKIDHLVDIIGELIINQALIEQYVVSTYSEDKQLVGNMSGFLRTTRDLQNLSMSLRMVSLRPTFQKVARIARDTVQELNKNVEFIMSGEGTEIDRVVTDKLLDPLVHLIKNAISHGVEETSEDRVKSGKNPRAKVELNAYSKRGKIFIEVKDDGRGIDTEIVYAKALEKGLIDPATVYSEAEIKEFILLPGFSTAKVVDNISGRGVGMDVVKTQILKIGGKVDIQSTLGKGSTFTLEVPVNHAIMNGTIIELNEQHFVIPTVNVKEFLQPTESQWIFTQQVRSMIKVRDNIIPIIPLSTFFKNAKSEENPPLVMILELEQELKALPITNVINRQEVVVKPVGEEFSSLKYISGMSILGTGKVSLILDIDYLFKKEVKE